MLNLEKLSKSFRGGSFGSGAIPAVRQVSFSIAPGEVTSLIGESGSGKSTIGKMILRLLPVTSGTITFDGVDVASLKGAALKEYYRKVQGVFQDPFSCYNPVFRVDRIFTMLEREYFGGLGAREWSVKLHASLEAVGLNPTDVLGKFAHELSGGQLQRLLVARALLLDIEILVADEVISMLDASTRIDVLNLLAGLKARGLGVLFITHDLSLGHYISEHTVILRRGVVLEMGETAKVFGNPQHSYTKMLLASVPRLHSHWEPLEPAAGSAGPDRFEPRRPAVARARRTHAGPPEPVPLLVEVEQGHLVAFEQGGPG